MAGESRPLYLLFHSVQANPFLGLSNISPANFRHILNRILLLRNETGREVVFSFDDGYDHLKGILTELVVLHRFPVHLFIPTAHIGQMNTWDFASRFRRLRHLNAAGIREMAEAGVALGSHGHRHHDLRSMGKPELHDELERSKKTLEDIGGMCCNNISYPFGRFDRHVLDTARHCGFLEGFTTRRIVRDEDPLARGRLAIQSIDTPLTVSLKLSDSPLGRALTYLSELLSRGSRGTVLLQSLQNREKR